MTQEEIDKDNRLKAIEARLDAIEKRLPVQEAAAETSASDLPNSGEAKSEVPQ